MMVMFLEGSRRPSSFLDFLHGLMLLCGFLLFRMQVET